MGAQQHADQPYQRHISPATVSASGSRVALTRTPGRQARRHPRPPDKPMSGRLSAKARTAPSRSRCACGAGRREGALFACRIPRCLSSRSGLRAQSTAQTARGRSPPIARSCAIRARPNMAAQPAGWPAPSAQHPPSQATQRNARRSAQGGRAAPPAVVPMKACWREDPGHAFPRVALVDLLLSDQASPGNSRQDVLVSQSPDRFNPMGARYDPSSHLLGSRGRPLPVFPCRAAAHATECARPPGDPDFRGAEGGRRQCRCGVRAILRPRRMEGSVLGQSILSTNNRQPPRACARAAGCQQRGPPTAIHLLVRPPPTQLVTTFALFEPLPVDIETTLRECRPLINEVPIVMCCPTRRAPTPIWLR